MSSVQGSPSARAIDAARPPTLTATIAPSVTRILRPAARPGAEGRATPGEVVVPATAQAVAGVANGNAPLARSDSARNAYQRSQAQQIMKDTISMSE